MKKKLAGYRDKISVRPGDTVRFMIHSAEGESYEADLVRIVHGSSEEGSPGLILEECASDFTGTKEGQVQDIRCGSFGYVSGDAQNDDLLTDYSFGCAVYPTHINGHVQTLMSAGGQDDAEFQLTLSGEGRLSLHQGGEPQTFSLTQRLPADRWSFAGVSYCADTNQLVLFQSPIGVGVSDPNTNRAEVKTFSATLAQFNPNKIIFGASKEGLEDGRMRTVKHFNGRLEAPRLLSQVICTEQIVDTIKSETCEPGDEVVQGFWDFSQGISTTGFKDLSGKGRHGVFKNLPTRAVCGFRWSGQTQNWKQAPLDYGAVHFHDDDIYDLEWEPSFEWTVPTGTRSGAYAARLRSGGETDYVTFFVTPAKTQPKARVAFLASTATYLAYANEMINLRLQRALYGRTLPPTPETEMLLATPAFGLSQYDHHTDGSGIHYSSYLRPIMNMRPDVRMWAFNADTALIHWLEQGHWDYDVVTDHDLHREGADLLKGYRAVVTATHPEYYSTSMLDGVEDYLSEGGRLMYMGGNGFYWRVAFNDDWPAAMEVRRAEDGTRAWIAEPGEYYHSFDGGYGGLWRRNRRPPNLVVGVGFAAQGFDESRPYHRTTAANDPRVRFMFEGVDDEVIGDFGLRGGGAGGEEIDRFDPALGSPAHALVVASAADMPPDMLRVKEEFYSTQPLGPDRKVRADLTFFETPSGGAVFSTGSIAWSGSLCHDNYHNNIARISSNTLERFISDEPFVMPADA